MRLFFRRRNHRAASHFPRLGSLPSSLRRFTADKLYYGSHHSVQAKMTPSESESRTSTSSTASRSSTLSAVDHDKEWLPQLIAKYGHSLSTAWIEERYSLWRGKNHQQSNPRVQGYLARGKYYFAWGNPICRDNEEVKREIAHEFTEWCSSKHKKVVWCCVEGDFADILGKEMDWSVLSCVREDVLRKSI